MRGSASRVRRQLRSEGASRAGVALSLALGGAACSHASAPDAGAPITMAPAPAAVTSPPAPAVSPDPGDPPATAERLRPHVVASPRAARRVLFTWTTRAQIDELARDRVLLTRTESPTPGPSHFDKVVAARAAAHHPLAVLLRTPPFLRARFAWPSAWPTVLGWPGETYGDELIRVVLRADAWIVKLRTSSATFEVVDLDDRPVALDEALRRPSRIAAAYFVEDSPTLARRGGTFGTFAKAVVAGHPAYREYVICNESMVESWSSGTPEIAAALASEIEVVEALRHRLARAPLALSPVERWNAEVALAVWPAEPPRDASIARLYEASLAFPNEHYLPDAAHMSTLLERLRRATPKGPPLSHRPTAVFPASSPPAAKPPKARPAPDRGRGTF